MGTIEDLITVPVRSDSCWSALAELEAAAPDLGDVDALRRAVHEALLRHPDLVAAWQAYSDDRRSDPSPYLDGNEAGFSDDGRCDFVRHDDPSKACADFICREAAWVLQRTRLVWRLERR